MIEFDLFNLFFTSSDVVVATRSPNDKRTMIYTPQLRPNRHLEGDTPKNRATM